MTTYTPQTWADLPAQTTPLSKTRLDVIEAGIATRVGSVNGVNPDATGNITIAADPAAGTAGLRTLGAGATQACAGSDARLSDARTPVAHVHSGADVTSGTLPAARLPLVGNPPVTLAYAASLTPVATAGNYQICTATGDLTLNAPSSPTDGQLLRLRFIASAAQRIVTFAAALKLTSPLASTLTIPSGKRGDVQLLYEAADGWTVLTATRQT